MPSRHQVIIWTNDGLVNRCTYALISFHFFFTFFHKKSIRVKIFGYLVKKEIWNSHPCVIFVPSTCIAALYPLKDKFFTCTLDCPHMHEQTDRWSETSKTSATCLHWVLTDKHLEMHECILSTVATDALVLKHQAISIHSTDQLYSAFNQFHQKVRNFEKNFLLGH